MHLQFFFIRAFLFLAFVAGLAFASPSTGKNAVSDATSQSFKINYLSRDFVYLKSGRKAGIENGDTLVIRRQNQLIAILTVEFSADYSSSCKILKQKANIILGDVANLQSKASEISTKEKSASDTLVSRVRELPRVHVQGDVQQAFARTRGNIAYQTYLEKGFANEKLEVIRQNIRMNVRMSELPGSYSIRLDMNASQRKNLFSETSENPAWENRVNQFSFGFKNPRNKMSYEVGRVMPEKISSIGYIDGATLMLQATQSQYIGVFGGNIPKMLYYETPISTQKYGGYYGLDFGLGEHIALENTAGFSGEYDGTEISREFLNLRNVFRLNRNISLSQVSEIELNRGWRLEKAGAYSTLSSMYVNGYWKASDILSFGIQYDTRQNYYRLNTRTLADSLFDHATRMGLKENVSLRFLPFANLYCALGHTQLDTQGDMPLNYSVGLSIDRFFFKRVYLNTYYTGFESTVNDGYNGSVYLRKSFLNGNDFSLGYGRYQYNSHSAQTSTIQSDWVRVGGTVQFIFKTYFATDYESSWGETEKGHRGFIEMGYWL